MSLIVHTYLQVPGVPSLVSRRKMTLKLNYIYMKVEQELYSHTMLKYIESDQKFGKHFPKLVGTLLAASTANQ
jgi:hypothetical protein